MPVPPPAELLVDMAHADIGVQEVPTGSNAGPRVNQMLANVGLGPGYYWCAAAVSTWGKEAAFSGGFVWPLPLTPDCDVLLAKARKLGILTASDPQPGDVFLVLKPTDDTDAFHTGIVVKNNGDGTLETIEGNSNLDGSNNGYEVAHKQGGHSRRITSNLRFIHWQSRVQAPVSAWKVTVAGYMQAQVFVDASGSVMVAARPFVSALRGTNTASLVGYNTDTGALTLDSHDLPVQVQIRNGAGYAKVRDLCAAFGGTLTIPTGTQQILVTKATPNA